MKTKISAWAVVNFDYSLPFSRIDASRKGKIHKVWAIFTTKAEANEASRASKAISGNNKVIEIIIEYEQKKESPRQ